MTGRQALQYADAIMENTFKQATKIRWLNQIEGEIQTRVLQKQPGTLFQYKQEDLDKVLIAGKPYDGLYPEYLFWQICQARQEVQLAENYKASFERMFYEYVRHICENRAG